MFMFFLCFLFFSFLLFPICIVVGWYITIESALSPLPAGIFGDVATTKSLNFLVRVCSLIRPFMDALTNFGGGKATLRWTLLYLPPAWCG